MTKQQKLITKLQRGSAFQWRELEKLMYQLGWDKLEGSGSRVKVR